MADKRAIRSEEIRELERLVSDNEAALARARTALEQLKEHLKGETLPPDGGNRRGPITQSPQGNARLPGRDQSARYASSARRRKTPDAGI
jgi:hypothetical protein